VIRNVPKKMMAQKSGWTSHCRIWVTKLVRVIPATRTSA
jgi:hypothetical protein